MNNYYLASINESLSLKKWTSWHNICVFFQNQTEECHLRETPHINHAYSRRGPINLKCAINKRGRWEYLQCSQRHNNILLPPFIAFSQKPENIWEWQGRIHHKQTISNVKFVFLLSLFYRLSAGDCKHAVLTSDSGDKGQCSISSFDQSMISLTLWGDI